MRLKLATAIGIGVLLVAASAMPANAATNTITIGAPPALTNRQLITVSITVVCDPLPDTPFASGAWVSFRQTSGKQIYTASGFTDSFSGGPAAPMLTCDGVTQNTGVVQALPDQGSGPFHGGPALVSAFSFTRQLQVAVQDVPRRPAARAEVLRGSTRHFADSVLARPDNHARSFAPEAG